MVTIKGQFVLEEEKDHDAAGDTEGEAEDVQAVMKFVSFDQAKCKIQSS